METLTFNRGIMSTCMAAIHNWSGAMALRFFLGIFESGYGPGIPYLLSFFYMRRELGARIGWFLAAAPLANSFSGALAYGITSGKHLAIESWRILFLVEGLPTLVMAPIVLFFLPNSPQHIHFLTQEEKEIATTRSVRQVGAVERIGLPKFKDIMVTFSDPKAWFTAVSVMAELTS
jgi:MFS family permease